MTTTGTRDVDAFTLSLRERRERLLQPTLELVIGVITSASHDVVAGNAREFVDAHCDTLAAGESN